MKSLRTRITIITLIVVVIMAVLISALSVLFIRSTEHKKTEQLLLLLCETGKKNLDYYFDSVQRSVGDVAQYVEDDIKGLDDEKFAQHMDRVRDYFDVLAYKTNGVYTYYYRIDPTVSQTVKGFWYTNVDGKGFVEHTPTDISLYDTSDTSKLVWFTVPKNEDKPVWIPPYITDNLKVGGKDVHVISYNVPVHYHGDFIGVVGIEIDYSTMAEQVESIHLYRNGYAFLNDSEGNLFFHPRYDVATLTDETKPALPDGVISEKTFVTYTFKGEQREAAWLLLTNGMRLNVTVPTSEMEGDWAVLINNIIIASAVVLLASSLFIFFYTRRIVRPLKQLTEAAEQADNGNYDYELTYEKDDELGKLTKTYKRLSAHMKDSINSLNKQVFVDALTHVKNKGAFSVFLDELQSEIDSGRRQMRFAFGVFDCDDLKYVNDTFGHDKGDIYLTTASRTICSVFKNSPVFRIGGDEFSVILRDDDLASKDALLEQFETAVKIINDAKDNRWEQVHIAFGFAEYDPVNDLAVIDVVRRADKNMYECKRKRKKAKKAAEAAAAELSLSAETKDEPKG